MPWDFAVHPEVLEKIRSFKKTDRRRWIIDPSTQYNLYSACRAINPGVRVSAVNEAAAVRALVLDFDLPATPEQVSSIMGDIKPQFRPTFFEVSLGMKARLVWVFESELPVMGNTFAEAVFQQLIRVMAADRMMAGYDPASTRPTQLWTNGGDWYQISTEPLSNHIIHGAVCDVLQKSHLGQGEINIAVVASEVEKRFPNRWAGEFTLGATGVRFWDPKADNPRGAYITPNGCYCFTGPASFVSWDEILGAGWVREQRALNLGQAADGLYFDGGKYWQFISDRWTYKTREDTLLWLGANGLPRKAKKGQEISDAERVLNHIQMHNRVESAVPLIFRPQGLQHINGERILNISPIKALPPAPEATYSEKDFPFIWTLISNLFERPELNPLDHFLVWLKRAYKGSLELRPVNGQAVFICGPRSNGKTLLCMRVIAPLMGGKTANPYDYLMKQTQFNSEIFSAGLLAINDEDAPHTEKDKEAFLQRLKSMVANHKFMYHPKFRDRFEIDWIGRLVVTLNNDAKSVGMLPELNFNTADKLHFFATKPYGGQWPEKYDLEATISKELPFFARWLLDTFQPAVGIIEPGSRCGMVSYHDPALVEMSKQQEMAYELRELLTSWVDIGGYWKMVDPNPLVWSGTPTELMTALSESVLAPLMREWKVYRIARSLTSLSRVDSESVKSVAGADREFQIFREPLQRRKTAASTLNGKVA